MRVTRYVVRGNVVCCKGDDLQGHRNFRTFHRTGIFSRLARMVTRMNNIVQQVTW